MSVPPVPSPATSTSTRSSASDDLRARALVVRARVRLVRVLERHEVARLALRELERELDRAVRALVGGRVDDRRAVEPQQPPPLLRRVRRHDARERVALELRDQRERDARVAARGLEQLAAGLELARRLGGVDHRLRDAVLDRAGRVLALELRVDADRRLRRQPLQFDERGVADEVEQVFRDGQARQPPAMAGRRITVEPTSTGVSSPSSVRTSSPST